MLIGAAHRDAPSGATLWPAALIVWGPGAVSSSHSHHSVQLILALTGGLRVRARRVVRWRRCGGVLVGRGVAHEVDAREAVVLIAFMDPESELVAAFAEPLESQVVPMSDAAVARWRRKLGDPGRLEAARVEAWVRSDLLRGRRPRPVRPAIRRVLQHLRREGLDRRRTSLARLAEVAGLSPSRFMHVFTESLGIPLRPYLLWLRVQRAAGALASGRTATDAAHLAGFADAAHLTRTFRRMLGATPRELIGRARATREVRIESATDSQIVQDARAAGSLP